MLYVPFPFPSLSLPNPLSTVFDANDECKKEQNKQTCLAVGQYCFDEDAAVTGDWKCKCLEPAKQSAEGAMGPAVCVVDECLATCPTCARKGDGNGSACDGQLCVDSSGEKLGDWRCECIAPASGTAGVQAAATCTRDECVDNKATCEDKGQTCVDPNPSVVSLGDWECHCTRPSMGSAVGHPAACVTNECLEDANMKLCLDAGQAVCLYFITILCLTTATTVPRPRHKHVFHPGLGLQLSCPVLRERKSGSCDMHVHR